MKKIFALLVLCCIKTAAMAQQTFVFEIKGSAPKSAKKIYLRYSLDDVQYVDSIMPVNNVFRFKKVLPQPVEATIYTNAPPRSYPLFLENGSYEVVVNESDFLLKKAPATQQQYLAVQQAKDRLQPLFATYADLTAKKDTLGLRLLSQQFDSIINSSVMLAKKLFAANPGSALSLYLYETLATGQVDYADNAGYYGQLPAWAKATAKGRQIEELIGSAKRTAIGLPAPAFQQADTSGRIIRLEDFRGNYVLLDFWASWCKPCREENPFLVKAHEQFRQKNFQIISIALEQKGDRDKWLKAIQKDNLQWTHLSSFSFFDEPVARLYGVRSIPMNVLLDPSGKIIAKNLRGEELLQKLAMLVP